MAAWRVKTPAPQLQSFPVWVSLVQRAAGCARVEVTTLSACTAAECWGKAMILYVRMLSHGYSPKIALLFLYVFVFFLTNAILLWFWFQISQVWFKKKKDKLEIDISRKLIMVFGNAKCGASILYRMSKTLVTGEYRTDTIAFVGGISR